MTPKRRSPHRRLAVLGYHKVGEPPGGWHTWFYVSEALFRQQLRDLSEWGWRPVDVQTFLAGLADPEVLPERSVLITLDDGYRSNLLVAAPILGEFGYPAVVFVPTKFVGEYNSFDADILHEPVEPICTWDELRDLDSRGVSVQSHGVAHRRFSELGASDQETELVASKAALEGQLGRPVDLFSYPYGDSGTDARLTSEMLSSAGYKAAFLYGGNTLALPLTGHFHLARIPMGADTDLRTALQAA